MADPLLVIVGPTASGKSRLGTEVAAAVGGEIISADACAVYQGLDIGTDKPDKTVQRKIRHHLLDVADARQRFSAGEFAAAATAAIREIRGRKKIPIIVGGSHFYVRSLLLGLFPSPPRDPKITSRLTNRWNGNPEQVWQDLFQVDPGAAMRIGREDRQRIFRALEVYELTGVPLTAHWQHHHTQARQKFRALMVAPRRSRPDLYDRINSRVDSMFGRGLVEEVRGLLEAGVPANAHALKAIGYRETVAAIQGEIDLATAIGQTKRASRRLAKRQLTWLRHLREGKLHQVAPAEGNGAKEIIALWHDHSRGSGTT